MQVLNHHDYNQRGIQQLRGEAGWQLTHDITAGTTEFHVASYEGFAIWRRA